MRLSKATTVSIFFLYSTFLPQVLSTTGNLRDGSTFDSTNTETGSSSINTAQKQGRKIQQKQVFGFWSLVGVNFQSTGTEFQLTISSTLTPTTAITTELVQTFEQDISNGYEFSIFAEAPVVEGTSPVFATVETNQGASQLSSHVSYVFYFDANPRTFNIDCGPLPTGATTWRLWQWWMSKEQGNTIPGFNIQTLDYICIPDSFKTPRCPLLFCEDTECQECKVPYENLDATDTSFNFSDGPTDLSDLGLTLIENPSFP